MPTLDTYRKRAKQLLRWHGEGNYSLGGRVRTLPRFSALTDRAVLDMKFTLAIAQEIIATEAGAKSWSSLKAAAEGARKSPRTEPAPPVVLDAVPILLVRDVIESARYYADRLGFAVEFLHGKPPFYGAVARDGVRLHLRHVDKPLFAEMAAREGGLICATLEVENVRALYKEMSYRGAAIAQKLKLQAWGGTDFQVRDPDGNAISFVQFG